MKSAWKILLTLMFVFVITFVVFPGAFFDSHFTMMQNLDSTEFTWYSLTVILIFNVCDTIGRKLGGILPVSAGMIYFLGILRFLFIFTTIMFALDDSDSDPVFFERDYLKIANMVLFALTNGLVSTLCAIKAPQFVAEDQREQIGIFVGLFIALGIVTGSVIAIPVGNALPVNWVTS